MTTDQAAAEAIAAARYEYYYAALDGAQPPLISDGDPQCGYYRIRANGGVWLPVAIWYDNGDRLWAKVGGGMPTASLDVIRDIWISGAKRPIPEQDWQHWQQSGQWLCDPPGDVSPAEPAPDLSLPPPPPVVAAAPPNNGPPPPGHNSGDLDSFEAMRAQLEGDIQEAVAHYRRHPIRSKVDADMCQNWRERIAKVGKGLEEQRRALVRPLQEQIDGINVQYFRPIRAAESQAKAMGALKDAWIAEDYRKRQREAEEKAKREFEAQRAAAEAEAQRIKQEREAKLQDDPVAALTDPEPQMPPIPAGPTPVVVKPELVGTGARRSGLREPLATATIVDLSAAAAYYAQTRHPELVALVQRLANAAARSKARVAVPGCRMSWER